MTTSAKDAVKSFFEEPKRVIPKASAPLAQVNKSSKYSIKAALETQKEVEEDPIAEVKEENLPANHFTQMDLDSCWNQFLRNLRKNNHFVFIAISNFKLLKTDENEVTVKYSSETAKMEFDKLSADFFNQFKRQVKNFKIQVVYEVDQSIKKEVLTKRKIFEKLVEINPLLKDLDDIMKFDLS